MLAESGWFYRNFIAKTHAAVAFSQQTRAAVVQSQSDRHLSSRTLNKAIMQYSVIWLVCLLFLVNSYSASAQSNTTQLICYFEPLPELIENGKQINFVEAIQKRLVYPSQAIKERAEGRVFIKFTIAITGLIQDAEVIKGFRPDCDAAALQAVQKLPRFRPVSRAGKPVVSSLTVPVKFTLPSTPPKIAK